MRWKNFPLPQGKCVIDGFEANIDKTPPVRKEWNPRRPNANTMRKFLKIITPVLEAHEFSDEDAGTVRLVLTSLREDSAKENNNG